MASIEHLPMWIYRLTSLPSVLIHIPVVPTSLFFATFTLLSDTDGDCNYSRCQVRSYFPPRSTTKWNKTRRQKCYVCTCTEQNQNEKRTECHGPLIHNTRIHTAFSRALLRHFSPRYSASRQTPPNHTVCIRTGVPHKQQWTVLLHWTISQKVMQRNNDLYSCNGHLQPLFPFLALTILGFACFASNANITLCNTKMLRDVNQHIPLEFP